MSFIELYTLYIYIYICIQLYIFFYHLSHSSLTLGAPSMDDPIHPSFEGNESFQRCSQTSGSCLIYRQIERQTKLDLQRERESLQYYHDVERSQRDVCWSCLANNCFMRSITDIVYLAEVNHYMMYSDWGLILCKAYYFFSANLEYLIFLIYIFMDIYFLFISISISLSIYLIIYVSLQFSVQVIRTISTYLQSAPSPTPLSGEKCDSQCIINYYQPSRVYNDFKFILIIIIVIIIIVVTILLCFHFSSYSLRPTSFILLLDQPRSTKIISRCCCYCCCCCFN